jgi:hypothetical protein
MEWVSSRVKSWSSVRKQMPAMSDLLDTACEEYNWQWKTRVTPMLLLRWVAMDWEEISENDLVALMIAPVDNGANTTGDDNAFELVTTNGAPQWQIRDKKFSVKGGFSHPMVASMALEHLGRLVVKSKGMPFANSLVQPLRDWFFNVHLNTRGAMQPQKSLWRLVQRQARRGYLVFLKRAAAATAVPCNGGFALFTLEETILAETRVRSKWTAFELERMHQRTLGSAGGGGGGGDGGGGGGGGAGGGDQKLTRAERRKANRKRQQEDAFKRTVDPSLQLPHAPAPAPAPRGAPAPAPAPKKPKTSRPFWIPDDEDWKVVTGYNVDSYVEAVRA